MKQPRRRWDIVVKVGADSLADAANALEAIARDLDRDGRASPIDIVSGSPSVGYTVEGDENPSITHESYFAAVDAWLKAREEPA